jgi:anti-repressor protein
MHELRTFVFDPHPEAAGQGAPVYSVRMALLDGEPWWYAADVCAALDLGNPRQAVSRLDADEKCTVISNDGGPARNVVNEPGLYALALGSRKPEAKTFKRWITHEVLPAIRKTGGYQAFDVPKTFHGALALAAKLEQEREALACTVARQADDLAVLGPKAAFADRVASAKGDHTIAAAAKILSTDKMPFGQNRLFVWLRIHGYLIAGTCTPYQRWVDAGLFTVRERVFKDGFGRDHIKPKTHITGKGMLAIQKAMEAERQGVLAQPQLACEARP